MSAETLTWLNQNALIGYTSKRGNAWHYRASDQGDEPNHYEGAIPVEDVRRRLFDWTPVEAPVEVSFLSSEGVTRIIDDTRKAIIREDTREILGVFKSGYRVHGYSEWLISNVESILDADLAIGSAGLLRGGAVGWVQVEMEDTLSVEGVEYRPFLTAATSLDGSLATTYQTGAQVVVCDNTLQMALGQRGPAADRIKIRHSRNSLGRISDVRDALNVVHSIADDFAAEVERLCAFEVTDRVWAKFVDAFTTPVVKPGSIISTKAANARDRKTAKLNQLWAHDDRVAPWAGTAYGVVAAVNTYEHHEVGTAGRSKAERNAHATLTGKWARVGTEALDLLATVS